MDARSRAAHRRSPGVQASKLRRPRTALEISRLSVPVRISAGAAARDFRRPFRAAAKMIAGFSRLVPGSEWTENACHEPPMGILAVRPEHSFRMRGLPNDQIGLSRANASERHRLGGG